MYTYTWYQWLLFFYIYCFFGWIFESTYVSLKKHRWVNRGFLRLPMLPIYGSGAIIMLWITIPVRDNLILTWIFGLVGATALEYITGYVMERIFKVRYWDYSNQKFNLHGYICLSSSIAWGFFTILLTRVLHKPIENIVFSIPFTWNVIADILISSAFIYDTVLCTRDALEFAKSLDVLQKLHQELDILQVQSALLKMEAEDYLVEAAENMRNRLEDRINQLPDVSLEELKLRADGALDHLKDLRSIRLEDIRTKTEQQIHEQLKEHERKITAQLEKRAAFTKHLIDSNPSATSERYDRELKHIQDYIKNGHGQTFE